MKKLNIKAYIISVSAICFVSAWLQFHGRVLEGQTIVL
jgi:hypothetical protein